MPSPTLNSTGMALGFAIQQAVDFDTMAALSEACSKNAITANFHPLSQFYRACFTGDTTLLPKPPRLQKTLEGKQFGNMARTAELLCKGLIAPTLAGIPYGQATNTQLEDQLLQLGSLTHILLTDGPPHLLETKLRGLSAESLQIIKNLITELASIRSLPYSLFGFLDHGRRSIDKQLEVLKALESIATQQFKFERLNTHTARNRQVVVAAAEAGYSIPSRFAMQHMDHPVVFRAAAKTCLSSLAGASQEQLSLWENAVFLTQTNGNSLEFLPDHFKDSEVLVTAAVTQNGQALRFASTRLRGHLSIGITAVRQNPNARAFLSQELWAHPRIVDAIRSVQRATFFRHTPPN